MLKLCRKSQLLGGTIGYNPERESSKDHSIKIWSLLAKQFQKRRFLNIFAIGSYVKTMSVIQSIVR